MAKECRTCRSFKGLYTKAYCGFYRENYGRCYKYDKFCDKHDTCESYVYRTPNMSLKRAAVIDAMSKVLTDINVIKTALEERNLTD